MTQNIQKGVSVTTRKCEQCPECAVMFDGDGYHGCVPDSNSETCKECRENNDIIVTLELKKRVKK